MLETSQDPNLSMSTASTSPPSLSGPNPPQPPHDFLSMMAPAAPEDDGGSAVSEYKVEMRDADRRSWTEVARTRDTNTELRNCGIEVEHEYVFRVTAYNAGGESETSESSDAITAMERFVKPGQPSGLCWTI